MGFVLSASILGECECVSTKKRFSDKKTFFLYNISPTTNHIKTTNYFNGSTCTVTIVWLPYFALNRFSIPIVMQCDWKTDIVPSTRM